MTFSKALKLINRLNLTLLATATIIGGCNSNKSSNPNLPARNSAPAGTHFTSDIPTHKPANAPDQTEALLGGGSGGGGFADQGFPELLDTAKYGLAHSIRIASPKIFKNFPKDKGQMWLAKLIENTKYVPVRKRYGRELALDYDKTKEQLYVTPKLHAKINPNFGYGATFKERVQTIITIHIHLLHEAAHFYNIGTTEETDNTAEAWAHEVLAYGLGSETYACTPETKSKLFPNANTKYLFHPSGLTYQFSELKPFLSEETNWNDDYTLLQKSKNPAFPNWDLSKIKYFDVDPNFQDSLNAEHIYDALIELSSVGKTGKQVNTFSSPYPLHRLETFQKFQANAGKVSSILSQYESAMKKIHMLLVQIQNEFKSSQINPKAKKEILDTLDEYIMQYEITLLKINLSNGWKKVSRMFYSQHQFIVEKKLRSNNLKTVPELIDELKEQKLRHHALLLQTFFETLQISKNLISISNKDRLLFEEMESEYLFLEFNTHTDSFEIQNIGKRNPDGSLEFHDIHTNHENKKTTRLILHLDSKKGTLTNLEKNNNVSNLDCTHLVHTIELKKFQNTENNLKTDIPFSDLKLEVQ